MTPALPSGTTTPTEAPSLASLVRANAPMTEAQQRAYLKSLEGWKHTLSYHPRHSVFGWHEDGRLWSGVVEETAHCSVRVTNVLPGVLT